MVIHLAYMQLYRESFNTIMTQISRIYRNGDALGQKRALCSMTTFTLKIMAIAVGM